MAAIANFRLLFPFAERHRRRSAQRVGLKCSWISMAQELCTRFTPPSAPKNIGPEITLSGDPEARSVFNPSRTTLEYNAKIRSPPDREIALAGASGAAGDPEANHLRPLRH